MPTVARTTKHIIQAYKAVRQLQAQTQAKLDALLETNALYKLFEPDTRHPYYELVSDGKKTFDAYEVLVAGVKEWTIGSGTIADELDNIKARQIVNDEEPDDDLDSLRLIQPSLMTEAEATESLLSLYHAASSVWSRSDAANLKNELTKLFGKKLMNRHKETPELKITPDCRAAVSAIKKLAKELRDCGNGKRTIRSELERKQAMRGLTGLGKDNVIELLLK